MTNGLLIDLPPGFASWDEACTRLDEALRATPDDSVLRSNFGLSLLRTGRAAEALAQCEAALQRDRRLQPAWVNMGAALEALGRPAEAIEACRHAVALQPDNADAQRSLGSLARSQGQIALATGSLLEAVRLAPQDAAAWCNLALCLCDQAQGNAALQAIERARALRPDSLAFASNQQVIAQYDERLGAQALRTIAASFASSLQSAGVRPLPAPEGRRSGMLRVGYVSADLCRHPVGFLLRGVLSGHDPQKVQLHVFDDRPAPTDDVGLVLRKEGGTWQRSAQRSDAELAAEIRRLDLDVLVDLAGHTAGNRLGVLARRPARLQFSLLGWFASTGVPGLDGMLMGEGQLRPGHETFFTEPVVALSGSQFRYRGPLVGPEPRSRPAASAAVFGCFNNTAKLNPGVIECWAELLRACPQSRLLLKWKTLDDPPFAATLRARFERLGVDPARIELRGASTHPRMLAEYADIDIALDPFPFSGGMSTLEALWQGVPVITLAQLRPVSRQSAAVLQQLGLDDLVTTTVDGYVAAACRLATDTTRRMALRGTLRERMRRSLLGDPGALGRELEGLYSERLRRSFGTLGA